MRRVTAVVILAGLLMVVPCQAEYVTAIEGLRLREDMSLESEVVDVLPFATEVEGTVKDGWLKTKDGYLKAEYLSDSDPLEEWFYLGQWHLTAYYETGYLTASGIYPEVGTTLAHNTLPFGTEVYIKGHGIWTVQDRGPASLGSEWCDLYLGDYGECVQFGSQYAEVWIKEMP